MLRKGTVIASAVVAAGFFGMAVLFSLNPADSSTAGLAALIGSGFGLLSFGVYSGSRVLVYLVAISLLILMGGLFLMLLFAPIAWGRSNHAAACLLQGLVALMIVVSIASIIAVRRPGQSRHPQRATRNVSP